MAEDNNIKSFGPWKHMEKVQFNIGGVIFVTTKATLEQMPNGPLGKLYQNGMNYDIKAEEYFFDRNASFFEYVLRFQRTGRMHIPKDMCPEIVREEMAFWEIKEDCIAHCCMCHFEEYDIKQKDILVREKSKSAHLIRILYFLT